jgi:hypothetical protein
LSCAGIAAFCGYLTEEEWGEIRNCQPPQSKHCVIIESEKAERYKESILGAIQNEIN